MNTMATTKGEIVDMLTRSSAAMSAANNTIQETIALESAAVEITRNAETTGTAFKTVAMRIRGYDEETEELSEDLKNISGDIADLTKVAGKGGISLFTDETKQTYKSTYQILKEIAAIWDQLSDKNQAQLLEKISGKRGAQVVAGVISNFSAAEKAMEEMENAAGSADAEMAIIESSIDYKINKFRETWVGVAQELIDRGDIGKFIDGLTSISESIALVTKNLGLLSTAGLIGGTIFGARNQGLFQTKSVQNGALVSTEKLTLAFNKRSIAEQNASVQLEYDIQQLYKYVAAVKGGQSETQAFNATMLGTSDSAKTFAQNMREAGASVDDYKNKMLQGNSQQKSSFLGNALTFGKSLAKGLFTGLVITAGMKILEAGWKWLDKNVINKTKYLNESVEKTMSAYEEASQKASQYKKEIEDLIPTYEKLSKGVNQYGKNVSLTDDEFKEYIDTTNKLAEMFPELVSGWDSEGNAILKVKGDVEALRQAYKELQDESYKTIIEGGKDIVKQYNLLKTQSSGGRTTKVGKIETVNKLNDFINSKSFEDYIDKVGYESSTYNSIAARLGLNTYSKESLIGNTKLFAESQKKALELEKEYNKEIETSIKKVHTLADAYLHLNDVFDEQDSDVQTGLSTLLSNMITKDTNVFTSPEQVDNFVNMVVNAISDSEEATIALSDIITFTTGDLTVGEQKEAIDQYAQQIADALNEYFSQYGIHINLTPAIVKGLMETDTDALVKQYDRIKTEAARKFDAYNDQAANTHYGNVYATDYDEWYEQFTKENSVNTKEELEFWQQCIRQSKTREQAERKYLKSMSVGKFTGTFTEEQSKALDDYQSKLNSLNDALVKIRDDAMDSSSLWDLSQEFENINISSDNVEEQIQSEIDKLTNDISIKLKLEIDDDYNLYKEYEEKRATMLSTHTKESIEDYIEVLGRVEKAAESVEKTTDDWLNGEYKHSKYIDLLKDVETQARKTTLALNDAFSSIKSTTEVLRDFEEELNKNSIDETILSESILSSIAGLNDEMNALVAGYYGGVVTVQEIYDALKKQRTKDFENYKESYVEKRKLDVDYWNNAVKMNEELVKEFARLYGLDLSKFASFEESKTKIYEKFIKERANMTLQWYGLNAEVEAGEYYDFATGQRKAGFNTLEAGARANDPYAQRIYDMITRYERAVEKTKQIGFNVTEDDFVSNFGKIADAADSTKSDYEDLFDFFERRIEIINQQISKLDANLENLNSAKGKNTLVSGKIDIVQEEMRNYSSALKMYQEMADQALSKLSADLQEKIKNGAIDLTKLMGENGEEVNKLLEEYTKWADKVNDCNQQLIELKETLRDLALDRFNNIAEEFQNRFDLLGSSSSLIEKQISLLEEAGQVIGKGFYEAQINAAREQKETLEREKAALIAELTSALSSGLIEKGTDEWLEMVKTIQELDESILDCDQSVEQLQNSILALADQAFERLQNQLSDLKSQLDNINSLLQDEKVASEEGIWTDEGLTRLGSYAQQYELARHNVELYQEEIDRVNQAYADGLYSTTEYLEKISELTQAQWSEALAAQDAQQAIVDLNKARVDAIKDGIQKQLDAYKKLIDERKKALSQAKEMHDWEKTLAEKDKNIAKIRKRLALLANDDSAAANAERIKLEQELQDALYDLEETQYEHSIQAQQDALDQSYEDFEEEKNDEIKRLEEYLEDINQVFADSLQTVQQNTSAISNTIANIVAEHGVYISDTITNAWLAGEDAVASYGEELSSAASGFISDLELVEDSLTELQVQADNTATALVNALSTQATNLVNEFDAAVNAEQELINATQMLHEALVSTLNDNYNVSGVISGSATSSGSGNGSNSGNGGSKPNENGGDDGAAKKTAEKLSKLKYNADSFAYKQYYDTSDYATGEGHFITSKDRSSAWDKLNDGARNGDAYANNLMVAVKKAVEEYKKRRNDILTKYAGYATGIRRVSKSEDAWTQELGREAILSPTRNAILTKLNKGDSVLTKEQTDNLFKWGKLSPDMLVKNNALLSLSANPTPSLSIGNVLTINGNVDDSNIEIMKRYVNKAINTTFNKFSKEILKR